MSSVGEELFAPPVNASAEAALRNARDEVGELQAQNGELRAELRRLAEARDEAEATSQSRARSPFAPFAPNLAGQGSVMPPQVQRIFEAMLEQSAASARTAEAAVLASRSQHTETTEHRESRSKLSLMRKLSQTEVERYKLTAKPMNLGPELNAAKRALSSNYATLEPLVDVVLFGTEDEWEAVLAGDAAAREKAVGVSRRCPSQSEGTACRQTSVRFGRPSLGQSSQEYQLRGPVRTGQSEARYP